MWGVSLETTHSTIHSVYRLRENVASRNLPEMAKSRRFSIVIHFRHFCFTFGAANSGTAVLTSAR